MARMLGFFHVSRMWGVRAAKLPTAHQTQAARRSRPMSHPLSPAAQAVLTELTQQAYVLDPADIPREAPQRRGWLPPPSAPLRSVCTAAKRESTPLPTNWRAGPMADYAWKDWPEDCPECGGPLQVFSDHPEDGWARDGDTVRCIDSECGTTGQISANGEGCCHAVFLDWE